MAIVLLMRVCAAASTVTAGEKEGLDGWDQVLVPYVTQPAVLCVCLCVCLCVFVCVCGGGGGGGGDVCLGV